MTSKTDHFFRRFPKLQHTYERFLKIRGNPRQIGLGFALGLFLGTTPFIGLHSIVAVVLAALFKWNKIAALSGAWISNPLTFPFLYGLTWWVGSGVTRASVATGLPLSWDVEYLIALIKKSPQILHILIVGGVVVGLPLALAGYFVAVWGVKKYRRNVKGKFHLRKARPHTPSESDQLDN